MSDEIQKFFKDNSYVVINNFIDKQLAHLLYEYIKVNVQRSDYKYQNDIDLYNEHWDGNWIDPQAPGAYSRYGDPMFDTILNEASNTMQNYTGANTIPTYSYYRLYTQNDKLVRHKDRPSCEISTTLCIGYDVENVDQNTYPDYNWPMWVQNKNGEELPVKLYPGDMIIYRGHDIDHWREPFKGRNHAQVFLHYNDEDGPFAKKWDGRPILGIPRGFQTRREK